MGNIAHIDCLFPRTIAYTIAHTVAPAAAGSGMKRRQRPAAEAALPRILAAHHPRPISRERLSEESGYSATSSSFQAAIGSLRRNGLAESNGQEIGAAEALFLSGEG